MAERKTPKVSIGITSMAVILCVLCLTVFSVLTLSTALSEREFSQKRADAVKAYYAAETECAALANMLHAEWEAGVSREALCTLAEENGVTIAENKTTLIFTYISPIDKGQCIVMELQLEDCFDVIRWQVVSTAEWTPDESLDVWDGELLLAE